ncbi:MAG TPA: hypothetical protein VGG06_21500 [Thermoanaerobaculia bacterium]
MKVLKFGGSSLATAERIAGVVGIVVAARREGAAAVVVSALGGVTDALLDAARRASAGETVYADALAALERRHLETLEALAAPDEAAAAPAAAPGGPSRRRHQRVGFGKEPAVVVDAAEGARVAAHLLRLHRLTRPPEWNTLSLAPGPSH